jgi:hypothetical protein
VSNDFAQVPAVSAYRLSCAVIAFALLAYALDRLPPSSKFFTLLLVLAALTVALSGAFARTPRSNRIALSINFLALGGLVQWQLFVTAARFLNLPVEGVTQLRSIFAADSGNPKVWETIYSSPARLAILLITSLVTLSYGWRSMPGGRARFTIIMLGYVYLGVWVLTGARKPPVDVLVFQEDAARALLQGRNPYAVTHAISNVHDGVYPLEIIRNDEVAAFPYPPLSILAIVPGYLIGDIRWVMLAAVLGSAALMVAAAHGLGLPAGHPAELAAIAFLYHVRGLQVLAWGWTEPLLAFCAAVSCWAVIARKERVTGLSLAGLATMKQYGFLLLPALWKAAQPSPRRLIPGFLIALAVLLTFFIWGPADFWRGVVTWQVRSPFRRDSLSLPAVLMTPDTASLSSVELIGLAGLSLVTAGTVIVILVRRKTWLLSQAALANSAILLLFFVFNKAAHLNYYWLAAAFLAWAIILAAGECSAARGASLAQH